MLQALASSSDGSFLARLETGGTAVDGAGPAGCAESDSVSAARLPAWLSEAGLLHGQDQQHHQLLEQAEISKPACPTEYSQDVI